MTHIPSDDELRATLRNLKEYADMRDLARLVKPSYRTLYRHAEDDDPPGMEAGTRRALLSLFQELGLVGDYGGRELLGAVDEIGRRCATLDVSAEDAGRPSRSAGEEAGRSDESHQGSRVAQGGNEG